MVVKATALESTPGPTCYIPSTSALFLQLWTSPHALRQVQTVETRPAEKYLLDSTALFTFNPSFPLPCSPFIQPESKT